MSGGICPGECPGPTRGVSRNAFYESTILTYLLLRGTTLRHNVGTRFFCTFIAKIIFVNFLSFPPKLKIVKIRRIIRS